MPKIIRPFTSIRVKTVAGRIRSAIVTAVEGDTITARIGTASKAGSSITAVIDPERAGRFVEGSGVQTGFRITNVFDNSNPMNPEGQQYRVIVTCTDFPEGSTHYFVESDNGYTTPTYPVAGLPEEGAELEFPSNPNQPVRFRVNALGASADVMVPNVLATTQWSRAVTLTYAPNKAILKNLTKMFSLRTEFAITGQYNKASSIQSITIESNSGLPPRTINYDSGTFADGRIEYYDEANPNNQRYRVTLTNSYGSVTSDWFGLLTDFRISGVEDNSDYTRPEGEQYGFVVYTQYLPEGTTFYEVQSSVDGISSGLFYNMGSLNAVYIPFPTFQPTRFRAVAYSGSPAAGNTEVLQTSPWSDYFMPTWAPDEARIDPNGWVQVDYNTIGMSIRHSSGKGRTIASVTIQSSSGASSFYPYDVTSETLFADNTYLTIDEPIIGRYNYRVILNNIYGETTSRWYTSPLPQPELPKLAPVIDSVSHMTYVGYRSAIFGTPEPVLYRGGVSFSIPSGSEQPVRWRILSNNGDDTGWNNLGGGSVGANVTVSGAGMYQFKVQTEFANGSVLESPFSEEIEIHARPNFTTITSATSNFNVPRRADIWVQSDPNTYLSITSAVIESSSGKTRTYTWYSVEWSHFAVDMPFYTAQETTTGTYNYRVTIYNEFGSVTSPWFNNVNLPY